MNVSETPSWLFLEINKACNFRCKQCFVWMNNPENEQTMKAFEWRRVIRDYADWDTERKGQVVFGGGEALLDSSLVCELASYSNELGLRSVLLSNGSLLSGPTLDKLKVSGLDQISISIDAPSAEVFDHMRGVRGGWKLVTDNLRNLTANRGGIKKVFINTILCKSTLPFAMEQVDLMKEMGADKILFMPLAPTIGGDTKKDVFFERESAFPAGYLEDYLDPLIHRAAYDSFIMNGPEDFAFIKRYFENPGAVVDKEAVCSSGDRNVMIDRFGGVTFCFHMIPNITGKPVANVREETLSLRNIWHADQSRKFRRDMSECKAGCGILSCHRKNALH